VSSSLSPADPVLVGRVIRPRGIIGEVIVEPLSDHPSRFEAGVEIWLAGSPLTIAKARPDKDRWVLLFEGVTSIEEAEKLRGGELVVDAASLPPLDDDHYYFHDLVGCCLEDSGGTRLGTVTGVVPGTPGWLEVDHDGKSALVPMVRAFLMEVDLAAKRIVMDPPAGLFEASGVAIGGASNEKTAGHGAGGDGAESSKRAEIDAV
jgi:16S rRNA processing protein RimM